MRSVLREHRAVGAHIRDRCLPVDEMIALVGRAERPIPKVVACGVAALQVVISTPLTSPNLQNDVAEDGKHDLSRPRAAGISLVLLHSSFDGLQLASK
jgi:hypothetical protein